MADSITDVGNFNGSDTFQPQLGDPNAAKLVFSGTLAANSFLSNTVPNQNTPWNNSSVVSPFWNSLTIDSTRWNKLYPYRLLVVDVTNGNALVNGDGGLDEISVQASSDGSTLVFEPIGGQWIFNLPITPEQLNITDQFAINTTATLRGILEEHNGVKFKMINASGTFGVWPYRSSLGALPTLSSNPVISELQKTFGSTINAASNLANQALATINTATTGHPANKPVTQMPTGVAASGTGYYMALVCEQFLEQYAEAKKNPKNAGWRLVFDVPKQNQSFVVTPMQFVWQQNVNKAMQINYTMQFKAWRRISLTEHVTFTQSNVTAITPSVLQRVLNTITQARSTVSAALNLVSAVTSDVMAPINALRQTALLVKDLSGAAVTAADLGAQVIKAYSTPIGAYFSNSVTVSGLPTSVTSNTTVMAQIAAIQSASQANEGLGLSAVSNGQIGNAAVNYQSSNPALNPFSNADASFDLFNLVPVSSLQLNVAQQNEVSGIITAASQTTVAQLKQYRSTIQSLALLISNNFGAGSAFYNKIYNLPTPTSRVTPITINNYTILKSLYDVMDAYDTLTATTTLDTQNTETNMQYVAGLATANGITFDTDTAKILVPVPYGLSIEAIAARYLGDPQRWIEIATLNNLMDPYIDETGFNYMLISNASGRQITIGSNTNLYIGQTITLKASGQLPTSRTILDIKTITSTNFLITLDGLANLDNFTVVAGANIQAYLPNTVNSQQKIYVPSTLPIETLPDIIMPSAATGDPLTGISQVDWLLAPNNDIALSGSGDFRLSYGVTNILQALKIKMSTQLGSVLLHPDFGVGIRPGTSVADLDVQQLYKTINNLVAADQRFQGVKKLQIQLNGNALTISMQVGISGQSGVFPISYTLTI